MSDDSSWIPSLRSPEVVSHVPVTCCWALSNGAPLLPSGGAQAHLNPCDAVLLQMSPLLETFVPLLLSFLNMLVHVI